MNAKDAYTAFEFVNEKKLNYYIGQLKYKSCILITIPVTDQINAFKAVSFNFL